MSETAPILKLSGISKRYGGVHALSKVDFECRPGTIHAVLGENGAGKSTLIKVIAGVVQPDEGAIAFEGRDVRFGTPLEATENGIVCVFQELSLMPDLSVADNISISSPPRRFGLIDHRAQRARAAELLARIGCHDINPLARVRELPLSQRQMVEIAKALAQNPRLLILDEATSALTARDVETVYRVLEELRDQGLAILYISHRMHEIDYLADTLSVFRNGQHIETFNKGERSDDDIVTMMIGREISLQFPPKTPSESTTPCLEIENLSWGSRLHDISLSVARGEIVGLGGLDGQGQKELLLALFGVLKGVEGEVRFDGVNKIASSPSGAARARVRVALVPEDRKTEGLMLPMSVADNIVAASFDKVSGALLIDSAKAAEAVAGSVERLQIKVGDVRDPVSTLSGGNQQKVVIAKWLLTEPTVILLNDPTRGIDVGTKQELYRLLRELAAQDKAILLYSTDYDELIGCCDRVAVMYDGTIIRELEGDELTEQNIVASALNIETAPGAEQQA